MRKEPWVSLTYLILGAIIVLVFGGDNWYTWAIIGLVAVLAIVSEVLSYKREKQTERMKGNPSFSEDEQYILTHNMTEELTKTRFLLIDLLLHDTIKVRTVNATTESLVTGLITKLVYTNESNYTAMAERCLTSKELIKILESEEIEEAVTKGNGVIPNANTPDWMFHRPKEYKLPEHAIPPEWRNHTFKGLKNGQNKD